jgi:hypothetical protein
MKEKIFGFATVIIIIAAVTFNTLTLHKEINSVYNTVNELQISSSPKSLKEAEAAYELFKQKGTFFGLTLNHEDISNIEDCFSEMIGCLYVGDTDGAAVTKNRLTDALDHLRRLSGINIDAII